MLRKFLDGIRSIPAIAKIASTAVRTVARGEGPDAIVLAVVDRFLGMIYQAREKRDPRRSLRRTAHMLHSMRRDYGRADESHLWAWRQRSLGRTLAMLGEREQDPARLDQAATACRAALEVWSRRESPREWASTTILLGNALVLRARIENDETGLSEAMTAYRAALEVLPRDGRIGDAAVRQDFEWLLSTLHARDDRPLH